MEKVCRLAWTRRWGEGEMRWMNGNASFGQTRIDDALLKYIQDLDNTIHDYITKPRVETRSTKGSYRVLSGILSAGRGSRNCHTREASLRHQTHVVDIPNKGTEMRS
jgi:hypothetical protein